MPEVADIEAIKCEMVPIAKVRLRRNDLFKREFTDDLERSIKAQGRVLVPILVNAKLEVKDGGRRLRAARKIGLSHVPVIYDIESDDREISIIANCSRLALDEVEEATSLDYLLKQMNGDQEAAAMVMGITMPKSNRLIKIHNLPEDLKKKVVSGAMTLADALEFGKPAKPKNKPEKTKTTTTEKITQVDEDPEDLDMVPLKSGMPDGVKGFVDSEGIVLEVRIPFEEFTGGEASTYFSKLTKAFSSRSKQFKKVIMGQINGARKQFSE